MGPSTDWTQVLTALIAMVGSAISAYFAFRSRVSSERADTEARKSSYHALLSQQSADVSLRASLRHPRVPTIPRVHEDDREDDDHRVRESGPAGHDDDDNNERGGGGGA